MKTGPLHPLIPTPFANCIVLQGIIHQILFYRHQKANPILKQQRWQPWWRNCGLNTPLPSPCGTRLNYSQQEAILSPYTQKHKALSLHIYMICNHDSKKEYSFSEVQFRHCISFEIQKLSCITYPFPPCNSRKCYPDLEDLPLYILKAYPRQWAILFPLRCKLKCVWQPLLRSIPSLTDPHPASDWSHKVWWHL